MASFGEIISATYSAHFGGAGSPPVAFVDGQEASLANLVSGDAEGPLGPALLYLVNSFAAYSLGTRAFPFRVMRGYDDAGALAVAMPAPSNTAAPAGVGALFCQYLWSNLFPNPKPDGIADFTSVRQQWSALCQMLTPGDEIPEGLMEPTLVDMSTGYQLGLNGAFSAPTSAPSPEPS
ncbi:hypothetical protein [Alcanivorax sp. 1008]|uniref:hypothetical protein n=1 Tax=Alcanivorax sp. 1008 TaxID=2816853 RepID=UPI001DC0343F|nr:hypothetical protein [Alcanivorax sp. 1008]MCC1496742.1 hypothetical protein [Alcanivorax sp. 1008]